MADPRNPHFALYRGSQCKTTFITSKRDHDYSKVVVQLTPRYPERKLCPQGLQWIIQEKDRMRRHGVLVLSYHSLITCLNACGKWVSSQVLT